MPKERLTAFSDGVVAIIITIMVLELKVPHGAEWSALASLAPVFASYILSFIYIGIYWNNHHHLLHTCTSVNGAILWANNHLLFWLSLVPFVTSWMGENHEASLPTAAYGLVLVMSAVAYTRLQHAILLHHGPDSRLARAVGSGGKAKLSLGLYCAAVPLAFVNQWMSDAIYVGVALIWLTPDRRIERQMHS